MMKVFHEVQSDKLEGILTHGLVLGPGGEKRDKTIDKTDELLNDYCPPRLKRRGIDRKTNTYCYLSEGEQLIDITSGEVKSPQSAMSPGQTMLELEVDPNLCYVSDLDLYDQIKALLDKDEAQANRLAHIYWKSLQLLAEYGGTFRRPEAMVPYDISPDCISKLT